MRPQMSCHFMNQDHQIFEEGITNCKRADCRDTHRWGLLRSYCGYRHRAVRKKATMRLFLVTQDPDGQIKLQRSIRVTFQMALASISHCRY